MEKMCWFEMVNMALTSTVMVIENERQRGEKRKRDQDHEDESLLNKESVMMDASLPFWFEMKKKEEEEEEKKNK